MNVIRGAVPDDAQAIAEIHIGGWRAFYRGRAPKELLAGLDVDRRAEGWRSDIERRARPGRPERIWVIERDLEVIGFCSTGPSGEPDAEASTAEVFALYLRPDSVGTGAGRALFAHAVEDLRTRGFTRATLWVLGSNDLGRHFYEAAGWRPDGTEKDQAWGHHVLHEVRYAIDLS
jgi:GNAT superfamily N-acetyltransferase